MLLIAIFVELRVVAGRSRTRAGNPQAVSRRPYRPVPLRRTAWSQHGMASVNQTRPHCVNQMEKTRSKPLAARHGRRTAWARHGHGMLCVNRPLCGAYPYFAGGPSFRLLSTGSFPEDKKRLTVDCQERQRAYLLNGVIQTRTVGTYLS